MGQRLVFRNTGDPHLDEASRHQGQPQKSLCCFVHQHRHPEAHLRALDLVDSGQIPPGTESVGLILRPSENKTDSICPGL